MSRHFALCVIYDLKVSTRDITKAFVQSATVYVRSPKELKLFDKVLKIIRPLYGMPESPIHWFNTYLNNHKSKLGMLQVPMDPCLLFKVGENGLEAVLGLQVDDTLFGGTNHFLDMEEEASAAFPNTGRKEIENKTVKFNGMDVTRTECGYRLS